MLQFDPMYQPFSSNRFCVTARNGMVATGSNLAGAAGLEMLKKGGKMPYSPQAEMTFTEEGFSEFTSEHKTEQIYTAVECVSVVEGVAIYVHINKLMGFLLPEKVFESKQQLDEFITFLKTKVTTVDFYPMKK